MNKYYQQLLECFKSWAMDATDFLKGNISVFGDDVAFSKDDIFAYLFAPRGNDCDSMRKQCLEIIFSGLSVVTERLLQDHLSGGILYNKLDDDCFVEETKSVSKRKLVCLTIK